MNNFEKSQPNRVARSQLLKTNTDCPDIPADLRRNAKIGLPAMSELDVVRHYTQLSRLNFSIDTHFYPLGSCTMKYNPRGAHKNALLPGFAMRHPLAPLAHSQGIMACLYELQEDLLAITGMKGISLTPMAGAQGELAGVRMIKAYHSARNDHARTEMLVPDAAHGTNPASAVFGGFIVKEIPTKADGDLDLDALKAALGPQTAGIMLTNPSTLGVFERDIKTIADMLHAAGGLLYYDGANLNAILGKTRPGDMGFDVMHMNLHKTFATPHGGGGPGAGPIAVSERLEPFVPTPIVAKNTQGYYWQNETDFPQSMGRLSAFMGNVGILLRAHIYIRMLGKDGLIRVAEFATLNANYLMKRLEDLGYDLAFPKRRATHEFIVTLKNQTKATGITAMDLAKRLLDYQFHAPTTYFPTLVPECLLIEPTETESKQTLDQFIDAMASILKEMHDEPDTIKQAPHTMPVTRLDDVKAARELDLVAV